MADTILVIEDERLTRTNLLGFLRSEGFETLDACDGKAGIELALSHLPDLIICDILMPDLDGYDVLMTLQESPQTASIPFIFLTVTADEDGLKQSMALGADDYLSKPVTSQQLRGAIAAQLQKSRPRSPQGRAAARANQSVAQPVAPLTAKPASVESAKAKLLELLCQPLTQKLNQLTEKVEQIQSPTADRQLSQQLRQEFAELLSLVNEVVALQRSLTPDNTALLLENFALMAAQTFDEVDS